MIDVQFLWEIANRVETKVLFVVIAVKLAIENVPGWRLLGQALIICDDIRSIKIPPAVRVDKNSPPICAIAGRDHICPRLCMR